MRTYRSNWLFFLTFILLLAFTRDLWSADNQLTEGEKQAGWILLFDGQSLNGWMTSGGKPSRTPVQEGCLNPHGCGDYMLIHTQQWSDCVLVLDFKLSTGCNSGIFLRTYPLTPLPGKDVGYNGLEIQLIDTTTAGYQDTGALYDLSKPIRNAMRPAGEWNHIEITSRSNRIEVVLNGQNVNRVDLNQFTTPNRRPDGSEHKFAIAYDKHPRKGYIGLQDHGSDCWFKNIKLLSPDTASAEAMLTARSLVSAGDSARLQRVMGRASQGNPVTVAVIGGSITAGAAATQPEKRYGNRVAQWWRLKFPRAEIRFVNAGIGATGSDYGALRADRDLLSKQPDFVVVEYAVNDPNTQAAAETLEGLVRQILNQPNQPAVILLFTMNRTGDNAQEWQSKIGRHYSLPMVSFRDALWPEIKSGRWKWEDVEADQVHPNDQGHVYCAGFITSVLDQVLRNLPPKDTLPAVKALPPPLLSDLFERVALHEADALRPAVNRGWVYDPKLTAWKSDQPGSVIEFDVAGRVVFTMHYVVKGPMGKARVSVDGTEVRELNAWFDQTWGGYRQLNEVARWKDAGKHRVRFELLETKERGNQFRVLGIGTAGFRSQQ